MEKNYEIPKIVREAELKIIDQLLTYVHKPVIISSKGHMPVINKEVLFMPRRDGTGPVRAGAMSGRCLGLCNPANESTTVSKLGFGCGNGYRRNGTFNISAPMAQKELLTEQKKFFESKLEIISKQLENVQ